MKIKHGLVFFFLLGMLAFSSCVDEINLTAENSSEALVIDAWFGNDTANNFVKIYRTAPYFSGAISPNYNPEVEMEVYVESEDGDRFDYFLKDSSQIEYKMRTSVAVIPAKNYRLIVKKENQLAYQSDWSVMPPKGEVEKVWTKSFEKLKLIQSGTGQFFQTAVVAEVFLDFYDIEMKEIGFLTETNGVTEMFTKQDPELELQVECLCSCYIIVDNIHQGMSLSPNNLVDGKTTVSIGEVPMNSVGRFSFETKITTLSKQGLEYLAQVDGQQRTSGSIFDPAPSRLLGNISNLDSSEEKVLGGFFTFQVTDFKGMINRSTIYTENFQLNFDFEPWHLVKFNCKEYYTNALPQIPPQFLP